MRYAMSMTPASSWLGMSIAPLPVPWSQRNAGFRKPIEEPRLEDAREVNRVVTDRLSDLLLTPSSDGNENLLVEGTDGEDSSRGQYYD